MMKIFFYLVLTAATVLELILAVTFLQGIAEDNRVRGKVAIIERQRENPNIRIPTVKPIGYFEMRRLLNASKVKNSIRPNYEHKFITNCNVEVKG